MSLTRAQWIEMWESVKLVENLAKELKQADFRTDVTTNRRVIHTRMKSILNETGKMKNAIESVIGQME